MFIIFTILTILLSGTYSECVDKEGVLFRSRRNNKAPITWQVRKYMPVVPVNKIVYKGGWLKIKDMDGDIHWVKSKFITTDYHCVVVKNGPAPIKTEPTMESPDKYVEPAEKYDTFKFIGAVKGWINVEDIHGDTGWIPYEYLWTD
jgi:SH3-like domain-containing protein